MVATQRPVEGVVAAGGVSFIDEETTWPTRLNILPALGGMLL